MEFDNLEPGAYLAYKGQVKSIDSLAQLLGYGNSSYPTAETLATAVGWVYVALRKRRQHIRQIETQWRRGKTEMDDPPYAIDLGRLDYAVQVDGRAFLYKLRSRGRLVGLRWLDPTTIRGDINTRDATGYQFYVRDELGQREGEIVPRSIPREDLVIFQERGLDEVEPLTAATLATRLAAEIMRGVRETAETVFDNNALPPLVVEIPRGTQPAEAERIRDGFFRFFNRRQRTRERPVTAVTPDVKVTPIRVNPSDMAFDSLSENVRDEILAVHDVPLSIAVSNAANYATAQLDAAGFIQVLGGRLQWIADTLNADEEIARQRLSLEIHVSRHPTQQRDEQMASESFQRYTAGGLTPQAAFWLVTGMMPSEFPPEIGDVFRESAPVIDLPVLDPPPSGMRSLPSGDDDARETDLGRFKRWYERRPGADVTRFESPHLTHADKVVTADGILRRMVEVYP